MTSIALALALQFGSQVAQGAKIAHLAGVNLRHELAELRLDKEPLKLITTSPEPKTIALTFDDGPHPGKTEKLLRLLEQLGVKATFFVVGKMVDKAPEIVRLEALLGHEVANHTYDHPNLEILTESQIATEYQLCSNAIFRATGQHPKFCRPPGGRFDADVVKAATDQGMYTVLWTDDPGDFARPDPRVLVDRIDRQMKNGGILLLHDGIPQTLEILPALVQELRKKGYRFVTCSEILSRQEALASMKGSTKRAALSMVSKRRR